MMYNNAHLFNALSVTIGGGGMTTIWSTND